MSTTVNLAEKYQKQIQQKYTLESLLKSRLEHNLDFVGARTVRVYTVGTVPLNKYDRTASANRYGTPQEVGDSLQELTMSQDIAFSGIIDKGNGLDQSINKAGAFLKVQLEEKLVPFMDAYGFGVLGHKAGRIVGSGAAVDASNVIARLSAARKWLLNNRVPVKGRTLFVNGDLFNALIDTDQFKNINTLGGKSMIKGQIGEIFGSPVVEVPSDLLPVGVNFIWLHRSAASSPAKIADTKLHVDPPGISGNLVEGRNYFDTFVFGAKAEGVYVDVTTSSGGAVVLGALSVNAATGAITGAASGAVVRYTLDETDPRYSVTAMVGTASGAAAGQVVQAYQDKPDDAKVYASPVVSVKVSGA